MKKNSNGHLHQLADQNEKCVQGLEHLRSANKDARLLRAHFLILSHQQTLLEFRTEAQACKINMKESQVELNHLKKSSEGEILPHQ